MVRYRRWSTVRPNNPLVANHPEGSVLHQLGQLALRVAPVRIWPAVRVLPEVVYQLAAFHTASPSTSHQMPQRHPVRASLPRATDKTVIWLRMVRPAHLLLPRHPLNDPHAFLKSLLDLLELLGHLADVSWVAQCGLFHVVIIERVAVRLNRAEGSLQ